MPHPLLTGTGFNLSAIFSRAWAKAKHAVVVCASVKIATTLRAEFADALRFVWDEARGARAMLTWQAEQAAAHEAAKLLDARTREIIDLQAARVATIGIESTPVYLASVRSINARLAALGAR